MKIIKVGRNDPKWCREIDCEFCGAILLVRRDDLFLNGPESAGQTFQEVQCRCMACGKNTTIDKYAELWTNLPNIDNFDFKKDTEPK